MINNDRNNLNIINIMNYSTDTIYSSPKVDVMDMNAESILCASTDNGNQKYGYGNSGNWF